MGIPVFGLEDNPNFRTGVCRGCRRKVMPPMIFEGYLTKEVRAPTGAGMVSEEKMQRPICRYCADREAREPHQITWEEVDALGPHGERAQAPVPSEDGQSGLFDDLDTLLEELNENEEAPDAQD